MNKIKKRRDEDDEMFEYRLENIATKILSGICMANGRNYSPTKEVSDDNIEQEKIMATDAVRMALLLMEEVQEVIDRLEE